MLPTATMASAWRDIKVSQDHAFIVSEADRHGLQVLDLRLLRGQGGQQTFSASAHNQTFGSAPNIAINEDTGFAYVVGSNDPSCSGGFLMFDISIPLEPTLVGCYSGGTPAGVSPGPSPRTNSIFSSTTSWTSAG